MLGHLLYCEPFHQPAVMEQLSTLVAARGPAQVSVLLILSAIFLMTRLLGSSGTSAIPRLGAEYGSADKRRKMFIKHASEVYKKGYRQFRDKVYRLTTADGEAKSIELEPMSLC